MLLIDHSSWVYILFDNVKTLLFSCCRVAKDCFFRKHFLVCIPQQSGQYNCHDAQYKQGCSHYCKLMLQNFMGISLSPLLTYFYGQYSVVYCTQITKKFLDILCLRGRIRVIVEIRGHHNCSWINEGCTVIWHWSVWFSKFIPPKNYFGP